MQATTVRDASCRAVQPGKYYLTRPGEKPRLVDVFEDDQTCDLFIRCVVNGSPATQRVDELAEDVTFHALGTGSANAVAACHDLVDDIENLLRQATVTRSQLRVYEDEINRLLGSQSGDGSEIADAVCAAVRDGVGSSIELVAMANG